MQFIYLLIRYLLSLPLDYEKQFKIGMTHDPYHREKNYGGYFGGSQFNMIFIEIKKVPTQLKIKYDSDYPGDGKYVEELFHIKITICF